MVIRPSAHAGRGRGGAHGPQREAEQAGDVVLVHVACDQVDLPTSAARVATLRRIDPAPRRPAHQHGVAVGYLPFFSPTKLAAPGLRSVSRMSAHSRSVTRGSN
jgi:hypothetical protein